VKLSPEECSNLKLDPETLRLDVQQVQMNGFVLFEGVIPRERIATIRAAFLKQLDEHRARTPSNRGTNRFQMHVPFEAPFIDPLVIENPLALSILDTLLGDNCHCHYFASDTALPGSDYQAVHSDIHLLFPETALSLPAYSIVVNIPLIDVRLEHGPVEIWPGGTHLMPSKLDMQRLAPQMHSELVTMPAGSLLIRDMRMWHRGTPNRSDEIRPHMALIYSRFWFRETGYPPIQIPRATYERLSERAKRLFRFEKIAEKQ
jgi:ectoine hydroxylase-related dioxygenase (phytanoyl-CoA dioxygenase family)